MRTVGLYGAFAALVAVLSLAPAATASFPGRNGRIWYSHHEVDLGAETGPRGFDSEVLESFAPNGIEDRADSLFGCPPGCHDASPAFAPDGRSIVFNRAAQNGVSNQIWVAAPDGSALRQVPVVGWSAQWSPSGKRLVFGRGMFGAGRLYTVRLDGTHLRRLTHGHRDGGPAWSINGLIVFQRAVSNRDGADLFVIGANGRGLRRLTRGGGGTPDWSPDGKRVAFVRHNDIYVIEANGRGLRRLTQGGGNDTDPVWSPDGRWIAFTRWGLYVMRSNGHGLRRLLWPPPTGHPDVEAFFDGSDWQALPPHR
jgi:Tol biopolymer transport system component